MIRGARHASPRRRRSRPVRARSFLLLPRTRYFATVFILFLLLTGVFYNAIRRHDVDLTFEERLSLGRHIQTFGNTTVYVVESGGDDLLLGRLVAGDWRKISARIDYVAYVYDGVYIGDIFPLLHEALEDVRPQGWGIAVFSCGCLMHNVLLQYASVRFEGLECAMLPGFVMDKEAVRWVETPADTGECQRRDRVLGQGWYKSQSWKLQTAREEYAGVKKILLRDERARESPVAKKFIAVRSGR